MTNCSSFGDSFRFVSVSLSGFSGISLVLVFPFILVSLSKIFVKDASVLEFHLVSFWFLFPRFLLKMLQFWSFVSFRFGFCFSAFC